MSTYKCFLECVNMTHAPVPLPHRVPVTVGRSPQTLIQDKKLSREQVEITADCIKCRATVRQLGNNSCYFHDRPVAKGDTVILKQNEVIYLLNAQYPHRVIFKAGDDDKTMNDPASAKVNGSKSRKRPQNEESESETVTKRLRQDDISNSDDNDDDDDDEDVKTVEEKLRQMRESVNLQSEKVADVPMNIDAEVNSKGKPLDRANWTEKDTLMVYHSKNLASSAKIAAFDIDGTIVCTQSGKVFPVHPGDWKILYPEIPKTLKKLHADGYKIVFITNQMGIQRGKVKIPEFKQKVESIISKLGVPVHVLVSKGAGPYRKPGLGMWNHLLNYDNDGIKVDMEKSLYVGDAAGRPKDWEQGKKKDFSCSDRLFALNAQLKFYTPEEFFLKKPAAKYNLPEFDPRKLDTNVPLLSPSSAKLTLDRQEIIIMVGSPASGKTHFVKHNLIPKGYVHISRDVHKTWQKCVELCKTSLNQGKSVVIDNTNPDTESRKRYLDVGKSKNIPCRCFVMATTMAQAKHNERFREMTDKSHQPINDMILNSYKSKFKEPDIAEGFTEIVKVNFVPKFKDKEEQEIYCKFLMDK